MSYVKNFRELGVYKNARDLSKEIYEITREFPLEEKYSLVDQIRRSSRSIGGQIAESWGKRRYENHFISKLTDADSEQYETQHWIEISYECGYIDQSKMKSMIAKCETIGKMLFSMMNKSSKFCQNIN